MMNGINKIMPNKLMALKKFLLLKYNLIENSFFNFLKKCTLNIKYTDLWSIFLYKYYPYHLIVVFDNGNDALCKIHRLWVLFVLIYIKLFRLLGLYYT